MVRSLLVTHAFSPDPSLRRYSPTRLQSKHDAIHRNGNTSVRLGVKLQPDLSETPARLQRDCRACFGEDAAANPLASKVNSQQPWVQQHEKCSRLAARTGSMRWNGTVLVCLSSPVQFRLYSFHLRCEYNRRWWVSLKKRLRWHNKKQIRICINENPHTHTARP